jgi:membrane protease YdiL (CAAX protease family)
MVKDNQMKTTSSSVSRAERYNALSLARPIVVALVMLFVVVALRYTEVFVPGLNTLPDKSIVSKVLGFILVLGYLRVLRKPISSIGLHSRNFNKAFLIGGLSMMTLYVVLYTIQFYRLSSSEETPRLIFAVINKETLVLGGLSFTLFHLFGQIVNAFMEESIFRGLMLPQLMRRFRFWQANVLQAFLFGLAHLVWPLMSWLRGQSTAEEALAGAASLLIFTTVGGLVFGYLYYRTDSLWTGIFAHLIDNSAALYFHIQIANRPNGETDILMLASLGFISLVILAWIVAKHFNLPTLKPWGGN